MSDLVAPAANCALAGTVGTDMVLISTSVALAAHGLTPVIASLAVTGYRGVNDHGIGVDDGGRLEGTEGMRARCCLGCLSFVARLFCLTLKLPTFHASGDVDELAEIRVVLFRAREVVLDPFIETFPKPVPFISVADAHDVGVLVEQGSVLGHRFVILPQRL